MRLLILLILFFACFFSFAQEEKTAKDIYSSYLKSLFYTDRGEHTKALEELERVRHLDPASNYIRLRIASLLIYLGKTPQAEAELKEIKRLNPDNLDASLVLIFLYSYTKNEVELEKEYEYFLQKAHQTKPEDLRISEYLAQFYFYKKRPTEAIKLYEAIVASNPNYVDGFFWLGYLYDEAGRRKDAITILKKALRIDPEHAPTLNALGYLYAEEGMYLDEAEVMIKKALAKEPENAAYIDSLGWVYFKRKDYQNAQIHIKKAVSLTKDPVIYEHLGDVYISLNNIEEAVKAYREGLSLFPDNKKLQEKLKKYEAKEMKENSTK
jgi:tetratricopeptide (TPR) repeat protein